MVSYYRRGQQSSAMQPEPLEIHRGHSWHFGLITLRLLLLCGNIKKYPPVCSVLNSHKHFRAETDYETCKEIGKKNYLEI